MNDFLDNLANYHYQKMHNKNGQDRVQKKVDEYIQVFEESISDGGLAPFLKNE